LCELAAQRVGRNEVDERLLAVDLHDRDQLAVARLELRISVDRDLLQLEAELVARGDDRFPSALAQVAPGSAIEPDESRYG
jgi:hypothetical protein